MKIFFLKWWMCQNFVSQVGEILQCHAGNKMAAHCHESEFDLVD